MCKQWVAVRLNSADQPLALRATTGARTGFSFWNFDADFASACAIFRYDDDGG